MLNLIIVFVLSAAANANEAALKINYGQWSTDRSFCGTGAQCISIENISYTHCVDVGFEQTVPDGSDVMKLGNMVFIVGNDSIRVWGKDGQDLDTNLDNHGCIPPRTKVYGPVPYDWTWVTFPSLKYFVGSIRDYTLADLGYYLTLPHPFVPGATLTGLFLGQYYEGNGAGIPNRTQPGNPNNTKDLRVDISLVVGG